MKFSDKVFQVIEEKLGDKEVVEKIRTKILAPTLGILRAELVESGVNELMSEVVFTVLWPIVIMMAAILFMVFVLFNVQLYMCFAR